MIETPRCTRAIVRKPDDKGTYIPFAIGAKIEQELIEQTTVHSAKGTLSPEDVFRITFNTPGVMHGFMHVVYAYDRFLATKDGGSKRPEGLKRRFEFRVGLYDAKDKYAEFTEPKLIDAVAKCLDKLGINLPPELK
jgi:hypothetical protein